MTPSTTSQWSRIMSDAVRQQQNNKQNFPRRKKVPMVDLPLGTWRPRIAALWYWKKSPFGGVKAFEPGLLAKANRGILYVDEVNLLDDHSRRCYCRIPQQRLEHRWTQKAFPSVTAWFVLVGSSSEGELRPNYLIALGCTRVLLKNQP